MTEDQILMRWNGIPIARINEGYKHKILKQIESKPLIKWYGHSASQWQAAFEAKKQAEDQCYENNLKAAQELAQIRRRKEYEIHRAAYKLLEGICKYANIM
jgi:hypothetical protein